MSRLETERRVEYIATCFGLELCQLVKEMEELALSHLEPSPPKSSPMCRLASNRLSHISINTREIEEVARSLAFILGCPTPTVLELPVTALNDRKAHIRVCRFHTANLDIELIQHRSGSGPFRDSLERYGPGVDHLAFELRENLPEALRRLQRLGGQRTIGDPRDEDWVDVDFRSRLGLTLELLRDSSFDAAGPSCDAGSVRVTHLRVLTRDIREASAKYAEVFQIRRPATRTVAVSARAARSKTRTAHQIKMAEFDLQGVTITLMEPGAGPALWRDRVDALGNGIYHLGLELQRRPAGLVRGLKAVGGMPVDLDFGGKRTFVDLTPQLGLIVEVATAKSENRATRARALSSGSRVIARRRA